MKPYCTTGEVGRIFGVCEVTVRTWIKKGILPAHRLPSNTRTHEDGYGCRYRIQRADVIKLCQKHGVPYEQRVCGEG